MLVSVDGYDMVCNVRIRAVEVLPQRYSVEGTFQVNSSSQHCTVGEGGYTERRGYNRLRCVT